MQIDFLSILNTTLNLGVVSFLLYKYKKRTPEKLMLHLASSPPAVPPQTNTKIALVHTHPLDGYVTVDFYPVDSKGKPLLPNTYKRVCIQIPPEIDPDNIANSAVLSLGEDELPESWKAYIYSLAVSKW